MEIISKSSFAKRCGVSKPTVYAWIKANRENIADYVTTDGIKDTIFNISPWDQIDTKPKMQTANAKLKAELEQSKQTADAFRSELEKTKSDMEELLQELNEIKHENELLRQKEEFQEKAMAEKDGYIQLLSTLLNDQRKALPQPKKPLGKRIKEFFRGSEQNSNVISE